MTSGAANPHKEQSGAILEQSLIEVEFYAGASPWAEGRLYEVAERVSRKSLFFNAVQRPCASSFLTSSPKQVLQDRI